MRDVVILFIYLIVTVVRLARPGSLRSVVAELVLVKHQLQILNRGRKRAPNLRAADRIIAGLCTFFMRPARVLRSAIALKPSILMHFHSVLTRRKYRMLFSPKRGLRPGPKGPKKELIDAVVAMKRRNPQWGCPRIAQQIALAFGVEIDKDVVRRILSVHCRPESDSGGSSWLTFLGHMKDSLWSCDLFRCESATLRTHWVLVVMDQFTRRIIGFGVHSGIVDGVALCRMFRRAIRGHSLPRYLSSDHDPLYRFQQWQANLRVLEVTEIKTVPYVPLSRAPQRRSITSGGRTHPRIAVKLVDDLAGASPASASFPVGTVVISGGGAGDQTVGSPEVNALVGWVQIWSAPTGGLAKQQVVAQANRSKAPK